MRKAIGILAAALMLAADPPSVLAAGSWSVVPSPSPRTATTDNILAGVSCASATSCIAVGRYHGPSQNLAVSWNGTTWSVLPTPDVGGSSNKLAGVSCVSTTNCTAVGDDVDGTVPDSTGAVRTLVETWNGTVWSTAPSPNKGTKDNHLTAVSCISASFCVAVGYYYAATGAQTLVERWNGTKWSIALSPNVGATFNQLAAVSCVSAKFCMAAGNYLDPVTGATLTLVEAWDGIAWVVEPSPSNMITLSQLEGVSCASAKACMAVGEYQDNGNGAIHTLVESWNGTTWSIVPSPDGGTTGSFLFAVSCTAGNSCTAVGTSIGGVGNVTLVESWDGVAWSVVPSANHGSDFLKSVSCASASRCTTVGAYVENSTVNSLSSDQTLAETWNGARWSIVPSPDNLASNNALVGVSCPSPSFCAAVGDAIVGFVDQTLVETWDGTSWSTVPSPDSGVSSTLAGISCVSASSCMAVGTASQACSSSCTPGSFVDETLVESWDGSAWAIVPSPNAAGSSDNELSSVSCFSTSFCIAVGRSIATCSSACTITAATLVELWNGATWSILPSPSQAGDNELRKVSCSSATACMAVGHVATGSGDHTLVESWDGTAWSILTSPSPGAGSFLAGVSCVGPTSCAAVGGQVAAPSSPLQTLVESWNGTAWSVVPSPNAAGTSNNALFGVSCVASSSCTAVGRAQTFADTESLLESWDGATWSVVASPNKGDGDTLFGASCASTASCTAVGSYFDARGSETLAEAGP